MRDGFVNVIAETMITLGNASTKAVSETMLMALFIDGRERYNFQFHLVDQV